MATAIDKKIEDAKKRFEDLQNKYNQNAQAIQQIQQEQKQLEDQGNALASRINTLEELKAEGESTFREVTPEAETAPAIEATEASETTVEAAE